VAVRVAESWAMECDW